MIAEGENSRLEDKTVEISQKLRDGGRSGNKKNEIIEEKM